MVVLLLSSLLATECKEPMRTFEIEAGKVNKQAPFIIEVKERKVNVRRFFAQPKL